MAAAIVDQLTLANESGQMVWGVPAEGGGISQGDHDVPIRFLQDRKIREHFLANNGAIYMHVKPQEFVPPFLPPVTDIVRDQH